MKKGLLLACAIVFSASLFAQQKKIEDVIKFKELSYDFGKIKQSVPAVHDFDFTNIGDAPIVIAPAPTLVPLTLTRVTQSHTSWREGNRLATFATNGGHVLGLSSNGCSR
jgi:hypothetical protein